MATDTCDATGFIWRRRIQAPNSTDFVVPLRGCGRVPSQSRRLAPTGKLQVCLVRAGR